MTVSVASGHTNYSKQQQVSQLQASLNAGGPAQQSSIAQLLVQSQTELVEQHLATGRLDAASVISTCNVPLSADTSAHITNLSNTLTVQKLTSGNAETELKFARIGAIRDAMARGKVSAATILSVMP
jgi:hypothetical protein